MFSRRKLKQEQGQSMVEFALVLPVLCLVLFGIIQFGVIYNDYITVTDATRVGARKAAVSRHSATPTGDTIAAVRSSASGLDLAVLDVAVAGTFEHGEDVTVTSSYPYEIDLLGIVVASGDLTAKTTERVE